MGAIELLNPRGLWLLTGLVPLVALYILKIKRERKKVASTWLWAAAQRDLLAKQPFRRLVAELPLILQILALIALSIALARPAMRGAKIEGDHVAIVIDTSASMATYLEGEAPPNGRTRIAVAKKAATDIVSQLAPGSDAIVIEGAKDALVACPLARDARQLEAAIAKVEAREVEGDLSDAVALAVDRLRALGGKRRVFVVTDAALAHPAPLSAAGMDLSVVTVGDPAENAGIVRVDVRAGLDPASKHEQAQVFAMIESFGARPRDAFVTLSIEGHRDPIASRRVLLPPKEKVPVVLTFEPEPLDHGKGLVVQLAPGDALPIDDVAYGRVPASFKMPVVEASAIGYSWVSRALDADPELDVQRLTVEQLARVNVDPESLVVVLGACPPAIPGRDVLVVAPPQGACMGVDVGAPIEAPAITSWESGDPRMRFLTMDGVHVAHATPLGAQGGTASLVRSSNATLVADASVPGRSATLVGFDVGDSDWPLKASFVLFVRNVVEQARLHRAQGIAGPARTGEPLRISVPAGTTTITVEGPGMPAHDVDAKAGFAIVPSIARAGLYRIKWSAPTIGQELVAANLVSEAESDVRPKPLSTDSANTPAASTPAAKVADAHNEWGSWLALLAALLVGIDVWWLTRRPKTARLAKLGGAPS